MNARKKLLGLIIVLLYITVCGCTARCADNALSEAPAELQYVEAKKPEADSTEIPAGVQAFLEEYLAACKEGTEVSVDYIYFLPENADRYDYYRNAGNPLVEYEIHDSVKINSSLYAFLISFDTVASQEGCMPVTTAWTYVADIDGEYRILNSSDNIPEALRDGFSEEDFTVPEEYQLVPEDAYIPAEDVIR